MKSLAEPSELKDFLNRALPEHGLREIDINPSAQSIRA